MVAMTFHSAPTITSEMWKGAQSLDVRTLPLSYLECNPQLRRAFSKVADQIWVYGESQTPILEKIKMWHADGNSMLHILRTNISGILVPTTYCIRSLEKKNGPMALIEIEELKAMLLQYQMLTYTTLNDYFDENPGTRPSHIMESFQNLTPRVQSLDQILFTCPCNDGF
jgi:hypothetical protein